MAQVNPKNNEPRKVQIQMTDGMLIPARGERSLFSAWRLSFYGAIALVAFLGLKVPLLNLLGLTEPGASNPYGDVLLLLPMGILRTFEVTFLAIFFAVIIGLVTGLGRISRNGFINKIATVYVEVIRGIPLLVQIFYIYFGIGQLVDLKTLNIPSDVFRMAAAVLAMAICYGAYMGEIFRAGIESISKGQMEAALSLGMTRSQAFRKIILPQTVRVIMPPLGNEFIALLKDSSLVSIVAIADILRTGREYAARTFNYFETYTVIALVYLIFTLFLSRLVGIMEERMRTNGK